MGMEFRNLWPKLNSEVGWFLESQSQIFQFKRGDYIYSQGDTSNGMYFVNSGLVGLTILSPKSGKEHLLRFFRPGQFFGHRSMFSKESYHGNAIAMEATKIKFVSRAALFTAIEKDKSILEGVIEVLSKELRLCETQRVMILENEIISRVAQSIVYLKDLHPEHNWTRQEIANFCASTVSTVIKAMAQLEEGGFIAQEGRTIAILNRDGLLAMQDSI